MKNKLIIGISVAVMVIIGIVFAVVFMPKKNETVFNEEVKEEVQENKEEEREINQEIEEKKIAKTDKEIYEEFLAGKIKAVAKYHKDDDILGGTIDEIIQKARERFNDSLYGDEEHDPFSGVEYKYIKCEDNEMLAMRIVYNFDGNYDNFLFDVIDSEVKIVYQNISWARSRIEFYDGGIIWADGSSGASSMSENISFINEKSDMQSVIDLNWEGIVEESNGVFITHTGYSDGAYLYEYVVDSQKYYVIDIHEDEAGDKLERLIEGIEEMKKTTLTDGKIVEKEEMDKIIENAYKKYDIDDYIKKIDAMTGEEQNNSWKKLR